MLICWNCYNLLICHFCHDWCVHPMRLMSTCVLIYAMPSFQRCYPCIFVICVLSASSLLSRVLVVADFSPCSAVIFMPCRLDATERSNHILRYFSKDVLNIWLFSIHSCPCLQLWSSLACHFRCIWCVHPMSMSSTCVLKYIMLSLQRCLPCIFVSLVVSASSLWSRVLVVTVLLGWIGYLVMLCKSSTTSHSMHNMEMFTKDVLLYMVCFIHTCPWLHL